MNFDIVPVLENYGFKIPMGKRGWFTVKCMAHDDSVASCRVNTDEGLVACMACDLKGNAISVVKYMDGVDYKDAVRRCQELTGRRNPGIRESDQRNMPLSGRSRNNSKHGGFVSPRLREGSRGRT